MSTLEDAFRRASPRFSPRRTPLAGALLIAGVAAFWIAAFVAIFCSEGFVAWSVGAAFLIYDVGQLLFVSFQARKLFRPAPLTAGHARPRLGVIVAAYNEEYALAPTLDALLAQSDPPDLILLADDGSNDGTAAVLAERYGIAPPPLGTLSAPSPVTPALRWLRLPHRGKANALNTALAILETDVMVTVDADTLLAPDALAETRAAFAADPALIVGGGVLEPRCAPTALGAILQAFQRVEYVRNFLGRFAWGELDSLLLVSGAFAAFRTQAVREVGGFDPASWVEDYELIHRLHRRARERGEVARVRILGRALATTDAPATGRAFLWQRRRWFAGFLQTQYWNRDLIGARQYGALGLAMLPFKCLDAAAPLYGLTALIALLGFVVSGRTIFWPAFGIIAAKIAFDLAIWLYALAAYRNWTRGGGPRFASAALLCVAVEPFLFQPLRHLGAARGWAAFLVGKLEWGAVYGGAWRSVAPPPAAEP